MKNFIEPFHNNVLGSAHYDGNLFEHFKILNDVKQGCVLAPTLFGVFFQLLIKRTFDTAEEGICLHTQTDGEVLKSFRLKAKAKVKTL